MNLARLILKAIKWEVKIVTPPAKKCIICIAPHTSNWDFIICELAIRSAGIKSGFLMKAAWFFFPLGYLFRAIGGIPVVRSRRTNLSSAVAEKFNQSESLIIAITPEGTRSKVEKWHKGFLYIAYEANVPLFLAKLDFSKRVISLECEYNCTGNIEEDMINIKTFYKDCVGKHPERFTTGL